jgi:hypothetical protein
LIESPADMYRSKWMDRIKGQTVAGFFIVLRLIIFLWLPYSAYLGFGDQLNFFRLAQLPGWPFLTYWVEFPPFFPFLSAGLYRLAGGTEQVYCYLFAALLTIADAGSLLIFWKLLKNIEEFQMARIKLVVYGVILCFFPYGWWYFDPIVVFFLLLSLWLSLANKPVLSGLSIAAGFLWKLFPVLALIPAWMTMKKKDFFLTAAITLTGIIVIFGLLWTVSPRVTVSSLSAQYAKGSWETVWALLDGNTGTGNFGPLTDRLDPTRAYLSSKNPAVIQPILPMIIVAFSGLILLVKVRNGTGRQKLALVGTAWVFLIIASPGWSPQWILYIIPLCLLVIPSGRAILTVILFICLSLAEWPLLFSRGRIDLLWIVILLRTIVMLGLGSLFAYLALHPGEITALAVDEDEP